MTLGPDAGITETVSQFLQQLGFAGFNWDGSALELAYENNGLFKIEHVNQGLLLARVMEIHEHEIEDLAPQALRLVHYDQYLPIPLRTGMSGNNQLVLLAILPLPDVTHSALAQAMDVLDSVYNKLRQIGTG